MRTISVERDKLLDELKKNKGKHREIFLEAINGWQVKVIIELEKAVKDAVANRKYRTYINLPQPEDHTPEYNRIIEQVEWSYGDLIELDQNDFNHFVLDDWSWKPDFIMNALANTSSSSGSHSSSSSSALIMNEVSKLKAKGFWVDKDE